MTRAHPLGAFAPLAAALALASCKGAEQVCNPTDPICSGGASVATVTITSPVDSVIALGRTATMTAVARDASSNPVTVTFNWTSTTPATATVNSGSGLVTPVAVGATTIQAAQNNNAVTGSRPLRVVDTNFPALNALLTDSLAVRLRQGLTTTPQSAMAALLTTCNGHVTTGHVRALDTCLNDLAAVSGGSNGNDNARLNVLDLYYLVARQQLGL